MSDRSSAMRPSRGKVYLPLRAGEPFGRPLSEWAYRTPRFPNGIKGSDLLYATPEVQQETMAVWFLANHVPAKGPYFGFAEAAPPRGGGSTFNSSPLNTTPLNSGIQVAGFDQAPFFNGGSAAELLKAEFKDFAQAITLSDTAALFEGLWELIPANYEGAPARDVVELLHTRMLERLNALEEALQTFSRPGIGHNQPPEPFEDEPLTEADHQALAESISVLKSQPEEPSERPVQAIEAVNALRIISGKVSAYLAQKGDVFVTEAVKAAGQETGKWVTRLAIWGVFGTALSGAIAAVFAWLRSLSWSL